MPILDTSADPRPFAMIVGLQKNFHWVLPTLACKSKQQLLDNLQLAVIDRALARHNELQQPKAREVTLLTIDELRRVARNRAVPAKAPRRVSFSRVRRPSLGANLP